MSGKSENVRSPFPCVYVREGSYVIKERKTQLLILNLKKNSLILLGSLNETKDNASSFAHFLCSG